MFQTRVVAKIKTHILYSVTLFFPKIMSRNVDKNMVEPVSARMTI